MEIIKTPLEGLLVIKPRIFGDDRGYFFESWSKKSFSEAGLDLNFVQDNQSLSSKGVRVIKGAVLDIAVDIRKDSPTYGQHFSVELSEKNKTIVWIPPGFAHGFATLKDNTIFTYKCTGVYNKESEGALIWNDKDLNINWEVNDPLVSEKDLVADNFNNFESKF